MQHYRPWLGAFVIVATIALGGCTDAGGDPGSDAPSAVDSAARPPLDPAPPSCGVPYPPDPSTADSVFCADPAPFESARVLRVVDGDTIRVEIDGREEAVRFFGIDTAERGERCFAEATTLVTALTGTAVRLRPDVRERDRNGRLLRYVYTADGLSIDAVMIATGHALAWTRDGALREPLIALEDLARNTGRGCLWQ